MAIGLERQGKNCHSCSRTARCPVVYRKNHRRWYRKRMDKGTMTVLKWDEGQQKLQAALSSLEGRIIHHNSDLLPLSL